MNKALEMKREIDDFIKAINKSSSPYLKRDFLKAVKKKRRILKTYCKENGLDYIAIMNGEREYGTGKE